VAVRTLLLRLAVILVSIPLAWIVAGWASGFTANPLSSGGSEGTPVTVVVSVTVLVVTLVSSITAGNLAINRLCRTRDARKPAATGRTTGDA
jgi:hypothetical protein